MRNKGNIAKYVVTGLCVSWLIVSSIFAAPINRYLSTFSPWISEGDAVIDYYSEDHGTYFELLPGEVLSLPVRFESRLARIGVYLGAQADSDDEYVFQLEDKYGSILGKTIKSLFDIRADDFVYMTSRSVISVEDTYYIKIFSESSNRGGAPLRINTTLAESFQTAPFSVGDRESGQTLVLDRRYQAVSDKLVVYIDLIFVGIVIAIWISGSEKAENYLKRFFRQWLQTIPWKRVNLGAIALLLAANIALLFLPETQYLVRFGNPRDSNGHEQVVSLSDGVVLEQYIQPAGGTVDTISILFATYTQAITGGNVHMELWDETSEDLIYSGTVAADRIQDNDYHHFHLLNSLDLEGKSLCIRLWAENIPEGQSVAVYLNESRMSGIEGALENGETLVYSLIFDLAKRVKIYRWETSTVINGMLLILAILYIWNFVRFRKLITRYILCALLSATLLLPLVLSFLNFREISMNGMVASFMNRSEWSPYRQYGQEALTDSLSVEREYDFSGELHALYERTDLPVNGMISDVTLSFEGDEMYLLNYEIMLYWDTGNGYNEGQSYRYQYIHQGQNTTSFAVPCNELIKSVLISVGIETSGTFAIPDKILPLNGVQLNQTQSIYEICGLKYIAVYICAICLMTIAFIWRCCEKKARKTFIKRNITLSASFAVIILIYGSVMAFLIPTHQVPDEDVHLQMLYTDIGYEPMRFKLYGALENQGLQGVRHFAGKVVDVSAYIDASDNKLEDYSFHYAVPSILVVRRPGQIVGVLVGQLLRLPAYWILQLGELGALVVYAALGALTLKIIPFKKNLMMMIMLLPVAVQEAGSFAYDSFTNALSFLTIAYILYLKFKAEKVSWGQVGILLLLAMGLLLGKVIYVCLMGLVLTIPLDKLELKAGKLIINKIWLEHHRRRFIATLAICLFAGIIIGSKVVNSLAGTDVIGRLMEMLVSFPQLLRLCVTTILVHWKMWLQGMTGFFGYFDTPSSDLFMQMIVISAFVFALMHHNKSEIMGELETYHEKYVFSGTDLFIWYAVLLITFSLVLIALLSGGYRVFGIDKNLPYSVSMRLAPRIEGVQGRYFFPIAPLLFIPMHTKRDILGFIPSDLYKTCYYGLTIFFSVSLLLLRYWGVGQW